MSHYAIQIDSLSKRYRNGVEALKNIALTVPSGCIFALLGSNGAGKSTLVKSLLTILVPTECCGFLLGKKIGEKSTLAEVGYLPEHAKFPEYLTGRQVIEYSAGMNGLSQKSTRKKCDQLLEIVSMLHDAHRPIATYSKGMRQRIGIAQALINDPQLIFLDEPTDGVDPQGREEIKALMKQMKAEGRTVFLNSHLLDEVEKVADRVAIMKQGVILREGSIAELSGTASSYLITTLTPTRSVELKAWCEMHQANISANQIHLKTNSIEALQALIDLIRSEQTMITNIHEEKLSLTDIYMSSMK